MQNRATELIQRAQHLERLAADAADEARRKMFAEMAQQWRDLAEQVQRAEQSDGGTAKRSAGGS